jgi:FkbM family methyltransferase
VSAACLRETIRRNGYSDIDVESIALGWEEGTFSLHLDQSDSGGHSLIATNLWNNRGRTAMLPVGVTTLDRWAEDRRLSSVDFIKMDVQGAEDGVLQGGLRTLARFRPGLLIEIQHETVAKLGAIVRTLGELPFSYEVRSMSGDSGSLGTLAEWSRREHARGVLFADYLFLPEDSQE